MLSPRRLASSVPLLLLAACSTSAVPPGGGPSPVGGSVAPVLAHATLAEGKRVYDAVCATCHTVVPPATLAPPMSHVVRHYRQALPNDEVVVARITEFVRTPSAERSLMPAHARERFGLMPAQQLSDNQLRAVAAYVMTLADPNHP
jgi:mono/diheme cytochrome c family protein